MTDEYDAETDAAFDDFLRTDPHAQAAMKQQWAKRMEQAMTQPPTSNLLTAEALAEIQKACDTATAGPWESTCNHLVIASSICDEPPCRLYNRNRRANAEFISRSREWIPALLAHVAAMQAELDAAKRWQMSVEEREAAVCPEDVGFDEYIRSLHGRVEQLRERVVGARIKHMSTGRRAIVNRTGAEVRDEIIQIVNQLFPTTTEGGE